MSPRELELALKRQRLQLAAETERQALAKAVAELDPLFAAADHVAAGIAYTRRHPELVVAAVALLAAINRRARAFLWRWSKRGFVIWRFWRKIRMQWLTEHR